MKRNHDSESLNKIFSALADPTRRALLDRLAGDVLTIGELAEPFSMTFAAVSKHIRVLEDAGLLTRTIDGRVHRCSADMNKLKAVSSYVEKYEKFWNGQIDVLERFLKQTNKNRS